MSDPAKKTIELPSEVAAVFREFRTCEMSTLAKDGTPITWPVTPFWKPEKGRFLVTTSIGLPQKAFNVRRNPCVSLLFSNSTGSGLVDSPAVLVQGDAKAPDEVVTSAKELEGELEKLYKIQPASGMYGSSALMRYLFDWYYMRLKIHITPRSILWWGGGDFDQEPSELEVGRVG